MRKQLAGVLACTLLLAGCSNKTKTSSGEIDSNLTHIAIVQYAQHPALDDANKGFVAALEENGYDESKVLLDSYNAQNDASNVETIATTVINNNPDLIFGIATPVAQGIAQKTSEIPLVISAVTDPAASGLVDSNELPGTNVTGASDMVNVDVMVNLLLEVVPDAKTVGIMYCSSEDNSKIQADALEALLTEKGLSVKHFTASDSSYVQSTVDSVKGQVDAMLIPTDNLMAESMPMISQSLNEMQIPSIVGEPALVEAGGTVSKGVDYYQLGYQAGLMAIEILEGKNPAEMPVYFVDDADLSLAVNQSSLDSCGLSMDSNVFEGAKVY